MFIKTIKSEGLAHLSYLVGDRGQAAVIDPRRDCEIYVERARERGCRIAHILETHRNEDVVSGARALAQMTGAPVHYGPDGERGGSYGRSARNGDRFKLGTAEIEVIETPGHTDDSLSFALYDTSTGEHAVGVFTGDALFIGDVGRTDFYPKRAKEVAGLLFDSLRRIVALGDQAVVYPAHGAGSVCGNGMADREFSTVGYERLNNPMLQIGDRDAFIARKVAEHHYRPPYFSLMERMNRDGGGPALRISTPPALAPQDFAEAAKRAVIVDARNVTAFLGGHLPQSLAIPDHMLPSFGGWLLDPSDEIILVATDAAQAERAARHLARIGYDRVTGYLTTSLTGWAAAARPVVSTLVADVVEVARRVADPPSGWTLLDVRGKAEVDKGVIAGSRHVYVGELPRRLDRLDPDRRYTVMCASGARATIAASVLTRAGFPHVDVFLGSMGAWTASGHTTTAPVPSEEAIA